MWSLYQSSWGSDSSNSWTCSWLTNIHEVIVRACMWPYMSILYYLKNRGVLSHRLCDEGGKRRCVWWPAYVATSMWRAWVCGPVWATIEPAIYIGRARYTGRQVEFYYQTELRKEQSFFFLLSNLSSISISLTISCRRRRVDCQGLQGVSMKLEFEHSS